MVYGTRSVRRNEVEEKRFFLEAIQEIQIKRPMLAQVNVCNGCCCGQTQKGRPEVPLLWLKSEWKRRGLLKRVHLSISGCLGPCDVANVVMITNCHGTLWLANLNSQYHYDLLADWAEQSKDADQLQPLPQALRSKSFSPYREQHPLTFEKPAE
jgi:hypothetical protein